MSNIEKNKIIALFMDWQNYGGKLLSTAGHMYDYKDIPFDRSWDYLMPAAYKVYAANMNIDFESWEFESLYFRDALISMNINKVFPAVIKAIEWYNKNKA